MQKGKNKFFILFFLLLNSSCFSQSTCIKSGVYDNFLYLGYDFSSKSISGYIDYSPYEEDKESVQITCKLFFHGKVNSCDSNSIAVYQITDTIISYKGFISFHNDTLKLKVINNVPSCTAVVDFNSKGTANFVLAKAREFKNFRIIRGKTKIFLRQDDHSQTNKYLIRGDIVDVLKVNGQWALIKFYSSKVVQGWVKIDNLLNL